MASPAETLENVLTGWKKLDINQKMMIIITIIVFAAALTALVYWVSTPSYSVLFSNLSSEDASSIVAKLQEQKIPYRLVGSQTIEVPSNKVYETRISLAGAGLPVGGTVGYEIFDSTNFGLSDFAQKLNYRRALEGELARTISQLNEVDGARVHIVIPEPALYSDKQNPATASVVIKPKGGQHLTEGQVQGVVNLVSKSVEGLKSENITVVDTNGNVLNEGGGGSDLAAQAGYTKSQLEAKKAYEDSLQQSIGSMLGTVLGSQNNAVVRVSADLDFVQKETQRDIIEQPTDPIVVSEQVDKEKFDGTGTMPSGVAGVSSQNASGTTSQGTTTYPQVGTGGSSKYSKTSTTRNYAQTKINEREVQPPGQVKKLSVAVVVNNDGTKPVQNATIEKLVEAAAGLDMTRGDVLTVSSVPFDTEWMKKEEQAIADAAKQEQYMLYGKYALAAILLIVGLVVLMKIMSSFRAPRAQGKFVMKPVSDMSQADMGDEGEPIISDISPERRREIEALQRKRQKAREEIQSLARERPQDVAQLIKIWLNT